MGSVRDIKFVRMSAVLMAGHALSNTRASEYALGVHLGTEYKVACGSAQDHRKDKICLKVRID